MIIRYSPKANEDLRQIKEYISKDLQNPIAAKRVVSAIARSCSNLKEYPQMGAELSKKPDVIQIYDI